MVHAERTQNEAANQRTAATLYGLVILPSGPSPSEEFMVVPFYTAKEADVFANRHTLGDWFVLPMRFAVEMEASTAYGGSGNE